ncbi:MAG: hypothetical protein IGR76_10020 [Synechococcales cyanobacterium T60_A2020_003]|nr:hypothetical protein [Synechococcales cyanobacterium T60_A2020_003]
MELSFADTALSDPPSIPLLRDRHQYQSCHILLPDHHRVAALQFENQYYSFFKTELDGSVAMKVAGRLQERGDRLIITQIPKGFALWVWEPKALPIGRSSLTLSALQTDASHPVLESRYDYTLCHVRVPDLDKRLAAIAYQDHYYSLFKTVDTLDEATRIGTKLGRRGERIVITKTANGYGLWVLEPDARLD